jgi:CRP-like cAMP-binding protein
MARARTSFDPQLFLSKVGKGKSTLQSPKKHTIFSQGDAAEAVFYIQAGKVKLTVVSQQGKEAVVAILERAAFFGESCLAGQAIRTSTATAMEDSSIVRIDKEAMISVLHEEPTFAELFMAYLLAHTIRIEEDLVDHLFNSSEKRLARVLLLLARFGKEGKPETVIAKISQETLAEMIGTTRSRVSFFMNKFRKLGFIEYNGELHVHSSLLNVILHD